MTINSLHELGRKMAGVLNSVRSPAPIYLNAKRTVSYIIMISKHVSMIPYNVVASAIYITGNVNNVFLVCHCLLFFDVVFFRVIVINCQSIRNNKAVFENLVESTKPDIVIGNQSWLHKDIQSSEVFPSDFTCYRNDRKSDSYGDVFIVVSDKYISSSKNSHMWLGGGFQPGGH